MSESTDIEAGAVPQSDAPQQQSPKGTEDQARILSMQESMASLSRGESNPILNNSVFGSKLNVTFGIVNSIVSAGLLVVSVFCMLLIFTDESTDETFCSILDDEDPKAQRNCGFKWTCFLLSIFLLLPYLYEAVQAADLFIGGRIDEVKAEDILMQAINSSVLENFGRAWRKLFYLIYAVVAAFLILPFVMCSQTAADTWKAFPFVVPSLFLNLALFPLAFLVIFSSQTVAETFVNLIAVQIFAGLADSFVRQVFKPESQLSQTLSLYFPATNFRNMQVEDTSM